MPTNAREFNHLLTLAKDTPPQLVAQAHTDVAYRVFSTLKQNSPRRSGRFAESWTASRSQPDLVGLPAGLDHYQGMRPEALYGVYKGLGPFSLSFISNGTPYGPRLNDGSSNQAPAHFVELAMEEGVRIVQGGI